MTGIQEQNYWPDDCHPGNGEPLTRDTSDMVWALLLERSNLATADTLIPKNADMPAAKRVAKAWAGADCADLWGFLASTMEAHPEWSDSQCRDLLGAWVKVRASSPGQAELLAFWRQRWKRQHRTKLQNGLAQAGYMTWAQKCRYCEIWSVSRRIMPPFCGVAELLLELSEKMAAQPRNAQADLTSRGGHESATASKHSNAGKDALKKEIIVVSPHATIEGFSEFGSSRQLLWALQNSGFSWSFRQPWDDSIELDPRTVRGVIFWSYRHRRQDFVHQAMAFEKNCQALKIPVINSVLSGWDTRHSTILRKFQQAGIPCPGFQKFNRVEEIELKYPLILRVDGVHRGQQMHLVQDADEAKALVGAKRSEFLASDSRQRVWPAPNLAVEFINVADAQGMYHKRRAYVVGGSVDLRHHTISENWLVNFASSQPSGYAASAHREFVRGGEGDPGLILRAGHASGSDVTALDYSRTPAGGYVFWEANRHFRMNGDKNYALPESVSESKAKRRAAKDRRLGEALLKLMQERFGLVEEYSCLEMSA